MKTILIYGDSNTWGRDPVNGRYRTSSHWSSILQGLLGADYEVFPSGLGGRIAGRHDQEDPFLNGKDYYELIYRTIAPPLDIIIVALGTNDIKEHYGLNGDEIVEDLLWYKRKTSELADKYKHNPAKLLYILPPNFIDKDLKIHRSEPLRLEINKKMKRSGQYLVEINDLELSKDGVHFSEADHTKMAQRVKAKVMEMLA